MDETSQVPRKECLHVHKVSDCARFFSCEPFAMRRCCLLFKRTRSAPRNWTRFAAQYLARGLPCERFTSALAGRRASLGVGAVGYSLPREGLAPPILCQLCLAHSLLGPKRTWRQTRAMSALPTKADISWHDSNVRFVPQFIPRHRQYNLAITRHETILTTFGPQRKRGFASMTRKK